MIPLTKLVYQFQLMQYQNQMSYKKQNRKNIVARQRTDKEGRTKDGLNKRRTIGQNAFRDGLVKFMGGGLQYYYLVK